MQMAEGREGGGSMKSVQVLGKWKPGSSHCDSVVTNPTGIHEDMASIPGLTQWVKDLAVAVSCGVGHRRDSDPRLLWLWYRPAASAPIQPLAWEPPYAEGGVLKRKKKKKESGNLEILGNL